MTDHDCQRHLTTLPDDPALPPHIEHRECTICERWFEYDTEKGELTVDN